MDKLIGSEFGKRFDYNECLKWWARLIILEQTMNYNEIQNIFSLNLINKSYNEADLFLKAKMLDSVYEMPKE